MAGRLAFLKGRGFKARALHPYDAWCDARLGVNTFGFIPAVGAFGDPAWQGHYEATPYRDIARMLGYAELGPDDVYVDLGCGLGRTVFVAHRMGAARATGVEIDEGFAAQCRANAARLRRAGGTVDFVCGRAEAYSNRDTTFVFLFHPFGAGTLKTVVDGLDDDLSARPRRFRLVYLNPVFDDVVSTSVHLRRAAHWPARRRWLTGSGTYPVSFWEAPGRH